MTESSRVNDLRAHIQACMDEYLFDVNGQGEWRLDDGTPDGDVYDVDQDVDYEAGADCVMVRRSDGAHFEVFVDVTVCKLRDLPEATT